MRVLKYLILLILFSKSVLFIIINHVYVCICVHVCVCVHAFVFMCVCMCVHMRVCMSSDLCVEVSKGNFWELALSLCLLEQADL